MQKALPTDETIVPLGIKVPERGFGRIFDLARIVAIPQKRYHFAGHRSPT